MTAILMGQLIDKKQITFDMAMAEIFPDLAAKMNPLMVLVTKVAFVLGSLEVSE